MARRTWIIKNEKVSAKTHEALMEDLPCGYLLSAALSARGLTDPAAAKRFLAMEDAFHDPFLLPDMDKALNRIKLAKTRGEKVAVYGDYDADGVTATVIMKRCLRSFGLEACHYLPDRFSEGYGMNKEAIDRLASEGVTLIITVDCGVSSTEEVAYARGKGIDTIVTDHHNCPQELPDALAVINPKRIGSVYPFSQLAGAGVAYKVAAALLGESEARPYLALAAIGTVADVVELLGENRMIVTKGLEILNTSPSPGISALLMAASKKGVTEASTISFLIAPRLNCAGRMAHAQKALELLEADAKEAPVLAQELTTLNRKRQELEQDIYEEALAIIREEALYEDTVIVACGRGWNPGVIGIAASKITEAAYRPCILIALDDHGLGRGSGRSIEGFDLYEAIKSGKDALVKFGGHALAAGISIEKDKIDDFRKAVNQYAKEHMTKDMCVKKVFVDAVIEPQAITVHNIEELSRLEPCGMGNEKPLFAVTGVKISDIRELSEGKHLKLSLLKGGITLDAIAFGFGKAAKKLYKGMEIHAAGYLEINDYTGSAQMVVKDILY